ncbi:MAG TPA: hypothetical protein VNZ67_07135, partial [bacterium]|nr:hypothetical protein [bacterium]
MRISAVGAVACWLGCLGAARAGVLAQAGPVVLGLAGPGSVTQTSLPFHLGAPARVWAEAAGLSGL